MDIRLYCISSNLDRIFLNCFKKLKLKSIIIMDIFSLVSVLIDWFYCGMSKFLGIGQGEGEEKVFPSQGDSLKFYISTWLSKRKCPYREE